MYCASGNSVNKPYYLPCRLTIMGCYVEDHNVKKEIYLGRDTPRGADVFASFRVTGTDSLKRSKSM